LREINLYKSLIKGKIKIHIWNINQPSFRIKFINSFFLRFLFDKKINKRTNNNLSLKLKLYFIFKNKFKRFIKKFIRDYLKVRGLTSHFVHFLFCKNLTYQSWAKYNSKLFNMNYYNAFFYASAEHCTTYLRLLLSILYSFSANPSNRSIYYDEYLNIQFSSRNLINIKANKYHLNSNSITVFGPLCTDCTNEDTKLVLNNYSIIENFLSEIDKIKKEDLQKEINLKLKSDIQFTLIFSRFFIFTEDCNFNKIFSFHALFFVKLYFLLN